MIKERIDMDYSSFRDSLPEGFSFNGSSYVRLPIVFGLGVTFSTYSGSRGRKLVDIFPRLKTFEYLEGRIIHRVDDLISIQESDSLFEKYFSSDIEGALFHLNKGYKQRIQGLRSKIPGEVLFKDVEKFSEFREDFSLAFRSLWEGCCDYNRFRGLNKNILDGVYESGSCECCGPSHSKTDFERIKPIADRLAADSRRYFVSKALSDNISDREDALRVSNFVLGPLGEFILSKTEYVIRLVDNLQIELSD